MKILFYEIRDFELNYLLDKIPSNLEPSYFKDPLEKNLYIDEKYLDAQIISAFVGSDLSGDVLAKFKNLKFIFLRCTGYSNVDLEYCKENNIFIFNIPNYGDSSVAEYAFSLILALSKKIIVSSSLLKSGVVDYKDIMGLELRGKTIGIIGLGSIGRKTAHIAQGFSMNILAYDIEPKGDYSFVELDTLLKNSDYVVINCPLTPETKHLIDYNALSKMKKTAMLINVARGEIVDTQGLYLALVNEKIKAAALDVIECEEVLCQNYNVCKIRTHYRASCLRKFLFSQKLMQLDNVIITPHNAYNTIEANTRILEILLDNIKNNIERNITSADIEGGIKNLVLI